MRKIIVIAFVVSILFSCANPGDSKIYSLTINVMDFDDTNGGHLMC